MAFQTEGKSYLVVAVEVGSNVSSEKPPKLKTFLSNFLKISARGVGVFAK